ncbi:MAG: hypothetical protein RR565_09630 [Erysipelothrix sp.]
MTKGINVISGKRSRKVDNVTSASYTATGIVWNLSATSNKSFVNFIPLEIYVSYTYWSQDEQQAGYYEFPTYIDGLRSDGTSVRIASFTVSDRFGNTSGSRTLQIEINEEFERISVSGKHWKYRSGSSLVFSVKKAKIVI